MKNIKNAKLKIPKIWFYMILCCFMWLYMIRMIVKQWYNALRCDALRCDALRCGSEH